MGRLTVLAVIAPVATLTVAWLAILATAIAGEHPLWGLTPRNLSEAAAFRDGAAIVRGVARGEDPAAAGEVRGGFVSSEPVTLTPLEAAARGEREEIVRLLLDLGAGRDAPGWTKAWCASDAEAVRGELDAVRPAGATTECQ